MSDTERETQQETVSGRSPRARGTVISTVWRTRLRGLARGRTGTAVCAGAWGPARALWGFGGRAVCARGVSLSAPWKISSKYRPHSAEITHDRQLGKAAS